jgi:hypothetical protein
MAKLGTLGFMHGPGLKYSLMLTGALSTWLIARPIPKALESLPLAVLCVQSIPSPRLHIGITSGLSRPLKFIAGKVGREVAAIGAFLFS